MEQQDSVTPVEGLRPPDEGPRDDSRPTRPKLSFWDRIKFILLLALLWLVLVWADLADNPLLTFEDAARIRARSGVGIGIFVLIGLEVLRQIHFLISERWSGYHQFWTYRFFGGIERMSHRRLRDWTRFRIARAIKWAFWIVVFAVVAGAALDTSPFLALFQAPALIWQFLPLILQIVLLMFVLILQFVALFWFLSRGGIETYYPDDIKTRFTDVWGQDHVLDRIRENLLFLEKPDAIEAKGGYVPGGILLWGPPGTGKGEPVSAQIMTPTGPRQMGSLLPGDHVVGADGRPTRIEQVHLLGVRDLFRVSFSDGTSVRVTEDHLWQVHTRYGGKQVLPVSELMGRLVEADGHSRYRIPIVRPVEFEERPLPLAPYLLGALLGDGTFRHHIGISTADPLVVERVEAMLPGADRLVRKGRYDYGIVGGTTRTILKELGLFGRYSHEKFVPDDYLWTCVDDRLEFLRGLMDTDGNLDKRGVVEYHTTSAALAQAVRHLVQSVGGTCSSTSRETRYRHGEEQRRGRPITIVRMALPPDITPVSLPRKLDRYRPRATYLPQRRIVDIRPDGREEARCLRVAAEDHLYVTENFIVTHNTLMAEAMAGETGRPYVFVDPGAFTNMFMGVGILKVKSLFRKLRKLALRYGGVIVFFDEADSLGRRGALAQGGPGFPRGMRPAVFDDGCHGFSYLSDDTKWLVTRNAMSAARPAPDDPGAGRNRVVMGNMMGGGGGDMGTLQALLSELSGLKKPRGLVNRYVRRLLGMRPKPPPKYRILTVMASNLPEALDEALLRPGRIDRIYKVGYPSKAGRTRTYQGYLDKVRHELTDEEIDKLAVITPYATGATIKDLVNEALIMAIRDDREVIEWRDIMQAKRLKQLGPPEDVEYIERERHAVAVHEACHAVAAYRTRYHMEIDIATIEKGAEYLGMVASIKPEDQFTRWRTEYESDIYVSLASLAGERMFFEGDSSSGVSGDLEHATTVATQMEGFWGMGSTVSSYAASAQIGTGTPGGRGPGTREDPEDVARRALADRIEDNLTAHLDRVVDLLKANRREILTLAHALETHKTLAGEDVVAVLERRQGPLVDGTVYQREELLREIEDYHRAAVAAHRGHAKVSVTLPFVPQVSVTPDSAWRPPAAITATPNGAEESPNGDGQADAVASPNGDEPAVVDEPEATER